MVNPDPQVPERWQIQRLVGEDHRMVIAIERLFERAGTETPNDNAVTQSQAEFSVISSLLEAGRHGDTVPDVFQPPVPLPPDTISLSDVLPIPETIGIVPDSYAEYSARGNATATTFAAVSTPTKALGSTTGTSRGFTLTDNSAAYEFAEGLVQGMVTFALSGTASEQIDVSVALDGTEQSVVSVTLNSSGIFENGVISFLFPIEYNEAVEVYLSNTSTTNNVTLVDVTLTMREFR